LSLIYTVSPLFFLLHCDLKSGSATIEFEKFPFCDALIKSPRDIQSIECKACILFFFFKIDNFLSEFFLAVTATETDRLIMCIHVIYSGCVRMHAFVIHAGSWITSGDL